MTQALFYQNPVALDKKQHGKMSVATDIPLHFARHLNAVPITLIELPHIVQFYPVAFSMNASSAPLALLGLRNNENLFVDEQGKWLENTYIPAYIRRYPFIFAKAPDVPDRLTLCIDSTPEILLKNQSNPLFDANGELTEITKNALDFCRSYHAAAEQTEDFSQAMEKQNILTDRHAEIRFNSNQVITLSGFRQIDESLLQKLSKDVIGEWHEKNWLYPLYSILFSQHHWEKLFQMTERKLQQEQN